jgi:acetyl esterase/lipase
MIDPSNFADWVSAEAKLAVGAIDASPPSSAGVEELRRHYDAYNQRLLDAALDICAVDIRDSKRGGIAVHLVTPQAGVESGHVLICLHGGAFMWGAGAGAMLEAVPLAAAMKCEVVAVDYRLAPEEPFPAAVEDVLAVYRALSMRRSPSSIGIYGCSAGGVLTAQSVARMIRDGMALPGAIAMLHGTGLEFAGDSALCAPMLDSRDDARTPPKASGLPYFASADLGDPMVMPGNHPGLLALFPPSLLVSATRDFAASACSVFHRRLLAEGVDARFVLFDGLGHAHHMDVRLPEAQETFALLGSFFAEHLR